MLRLFTAINIPPQNLEEITNICFGVREARWVPMDQIHLTLRFIGEVDETIYSEIQSALNLVHIHPFKICLKGVGYFPPRKSPKVLWVGVEPCSEMLALFNAIESCLGKIGIPKEKRKFHPHVTVARIKNEISHENIIPFLTHNSLFKSGPIRVEVFYLYSSVLSRSGAVHHKEAAYTL